MRFIGFVNVAAVPFGPVCAESIWSGYFHSKPICGICRFAEIPATPLEPMLFIGFVNVAAVPSGTVCAG